MASIETRIDSFITHNHFDENIKDDLVDLVNGCLSDLFKHLYSAPVPVNEPTVKKEKKVKEEKIEDPATVTSRDELRKCNTQVLNQFCKDQDLKIGGNKTEVMDRVWRFLQGEISEEDKSSRSKPKKEKKVADKHVCSGKNAKGVNCSSAGTELCDGVYLCWRHAKTFEENNKAEPEPEPVPTPVIPAQKTKSKRLEKIIKKFEKSEDELVTDED